MRIGLSARRAGEPDEDRESMRIDFRLVQVAEPRAEGMIVG
jgi:hypothetical protein